MCTIWTSEGQEGRLLQDTRGERMCRKQASWNLNLDCNFFGCVHTWCPGVHCTRLKMLLVRHQIKCECIFSKVVLVPECKVNILWHSLKWAPFPSVHIFSVRPRALLLPVCCFQTNSCCAPVRSIKCVYHHIFRKYHYLIKTTFCANACTPMLGWNNNKKNTLKNLNTAIFVPRRNVPNSSLDRGGFIPTFDCPSH